MNNFKALLSLTTMLAILSFCVNFTHHVSLLGGGDEGSYIACGKLMSERLSFVYDDNVAAFGRKYTSAADFAVTAFRIHSEGGDTVQVVSGWNKGFPLLSMPFWWLDPDGGWKYLNPLAGALALLVVFLIGTQLKGAFVGFSAAALLMTNFLQLWFSRYPMTEIVSQLLLLGMFLSVLNFSLSARGVWLWVFALLSSWAIVVHFGNVPAWFLMAAALWAIAAPYTSSGASAPGECASQRSFFGKGCVFDRTKLFRFLSATFVTGGIPAAMGAAYWFLDPGIQRYTKLGSKMADSSGVIERVTTAFVVRCENLALFVPLPLWLLVGFALLLVVREKGWTRRFWFLAIALALVSFALILFAGVGTPRVLYVARRNVPLVLPIICLLSGLAVEKLTELFTRVGCRRVARFVLLTALVGLQLLLFAPFHGVDQGKGAPELAARIRAELVAANPRGVQLVLLPDVAASFVAGLRYVYNVPAVSYSEAFSAEVIAKLLDDGVSLYAVDIGRTLLDPLRAIPDIKLSFVTSRDLVWTHMNPIGPTNFPVISDRVISRVSLYRVSKAIKRP
jgi:hypothetical protein